MLRSRSLARSLGLVLALTFSRPILAVEPAARLESTRAAGSIDQVSATLEVGGKLKLANEGKVETLPMSVVATAKFRETWLGGRTGAIEGLRALRVYETTEATIKIASGGSTPTLRNDRRRVIVAGADKKLLLFGADGPLTRDELELIELPCNTALIDGLLPSAPVRANGTWPHAPELMGAMFGLDAVGACDVDSTLRELTADVAKVEIEGVVEGAVEGVSTEVEVKGRYRFDRRAKRITWLAMLVKENRSIGHVGPGLEVTAKLQLTIQPAQGAAEQNWKDAARTWNDPAPEFARLEYLVPQCAMRVLYDRRWHVISEEPNLVTLRLVDRGDLLAQARITVPAGVSHEPSPSIEAYQAKIEESLGDNFGQFTHASTSEDSLGTVTHRVVAQGTVAELPIEWRFYLLTARDGRRIAATFTLEPELDERFGAADEELVDNMEFAATATQPGSARAVIRISR